MICAKIGAAHEDELAAAGVLVLLDDLGAGDVRGHEVGRELDAAEAEVHRVGERFHQERLGQSGHALEQAVAARGHGDEDLLDHVIIADDSLGQFRAQGVVVADELLGGLSVGERGHAGHDETGSYETVRESALYLWMPVKAGKSAEWHRACCAGRRENRPRPP